MTKAEHSHVEKVFAAVDGHDKPPADEMVFGSWIRSATTYKIDLESNRPPQIFTAAELRCFQDAASRLIEIARIELDHLYNYLRPTRYVILLCDKSGTVIDCRGEASEAAQYKYWGVWMGGVWPEDVEGTNGIGTCITVQLPVTVHRSQHFRARHISLSCSGAPIFDGNSEFIGILDVSSIDPQLSEHAHALTGALTVATARAIEERMFRDQFRREWIIAVKDPDNDGSAMLLSVDGERRIVGADRIGRLVLSRWGHRIDRGVSLWMIFERTDGSFPRKGWGDIWIQLKPLGAQESLPAIVTSPENPSLRWSQPQGQYLRIRPRLDALVNGPHGATSLLLRGGLPPATLRRVREFVDAHLAENIDTEALAATAGLSPFHFARAFKKSEGATPHRFVLQRRIAKAQELLSGSDNPISEIALAVGFADQSHFTRRFSELVGLSPGQFRKLQS
jgi:AraC-like DNA-binding protein